MGAYRPRVDPGEVLDQFQGSPRIEELADKTGGIDSTNGSIPNLTDSDLLLDPISTTTGTTPSANTPSSNGLYSFPTSDFPPLADGSHTGDQIRPSPLVTSPQSSISVKPDAHHMGPYANGINGQNYAISKYNHPAQLPYYEGPQVVPSASNTNGKSLQFKKPKPKKLQNQMTGPPKRPAFVMKLWNMVNDSQNAKYISWLPDGKAFQVSDRESFMRHVLPKYFKHNNFASFVRQLNMYGWHKIQDVNSGSLAQSEEVWQFENPNFIRGKENLLDNIVRNRSSKDDEDEVDIGTLMAELETMKQKQRMIADDLRRLVQDNELLWKENFVARERHKAQSETLDKILRFLATLYGGSSRFLEGNNGPNEFLDMATKRQMSEQRPQRPSDYDLQQQQHMAQQQGQYYQPQNGNSVLMLTNRAHNGSKSSSSRDTPNSQMMQGGSDADESPIQEIRRGPENRNLEQYDAFKPYSGQATPQFGGAATNFQSPTSLVNSPRSYFPEINHQTQRAPGSQPMRSSVNGSSATPLGAEPDAGNSDYLVGNINQQLAKQQNSIKQINDWITKLTNNSKIADDTIANPQLMDDFRMDDFLLPQTPNGGVDATISTDDKFGDLYDQLQPNSNERYVDSTIPRPSPTNSISSRKRKDSLPAAEETKRVKQV
ncbi:hypothetical protein OGAPHI_003363 [Ogataea philodendri]|uniref:Heat shock transcription factor n=1 Tax=Ogataea philodendri TaxID=1378263 RepID=A0A9P8P7D0_9ASCO|nr:uncharacterized protein OGAPHI_003363 [Ogataea philodendri]KAH3666913.1 hypothetical protein OGAPHI_003363 [Ogataea philodendri]